MKTKGFTLLELLVVVAIIAVLASLTISSRTQLSIGLLAFIWMFFALLAVLTLAAYIYEYMEKKHPAYAFGARWMLIFMCVLVVCIVGLIVAFYLLFCKIE